MNKEKTYKEQQTENTRGKRRYIERVIETDEANKQIKDFLNHPEQEDKDEDKPAIRPFS